MVVFSFRRWSFSFVLHLLNRAEVPYSFVMFRAVNFFDFVETYDLVCALDLAD